MFKRSSNDILLHEKVPNEQDFFNRDQRSIAVQEITWFQSIGQLWNISAKEYKFKGI